MTGFTGFSGAVIPGGAIKTGIETFREQCTVGRPNQIDMVPRNFANRKTAAGDLAPPRAMSLRHPLSGKHGKRAWVRLHSIALARAEEHETIKASPLLVR